MKLQRAAGQTSQILNVFAQDFSVTTGVGIANIPATTVSYTWFHNTQAAASTGTGVSTASQGNYTSGAWTQISSSLALGWYQFGIPDGALATGDCVGLHLYVSTGAFNMAPIPVEIELVRDNPLQFTTSKVFLAYTSTSPANITQAVAQPIVTSGAGILNVSTQSLVGIVVSTQSLVGITTAANVIQVYASPVVTSASGQFLVSTQSLAGIVVSTQSLVGITTAANVIQVYSSPVVTSASGQFRVSTQSLVGIVVSTQTIDKGGYGVTTNADKLAYDITSTYGTALVTSGAGILNVSTQTLAGAGSGDIVSVYGTPIVTSAGGILRVSTQTIDKGGYGVTTNADKSGYALTAAYDPAKTAAQSSDARFTNLDTNVGSRATPNDILATPLNESYRPFNSTGTLTQLMYEVVANVTDMVNSGTTRTLNSVTSHTALTVQYQYDSTTPSAISRIA